MAQRIGFTIDVGSGSPPFAVTLSDSEATYGARRLDGTIIVAAGTPMVQDPTNLNFWYYDLPSNLAAQTIVEWSGAIQETDGGDITYVGQVITVTVQSAGSCGGFDYTADQAAFLGDASETIEYLPGGVEANARTICAVIQREPMTGIDGTTNGRARQCFIEFANSPTQGVSSQELNQGADKFRFPPNVGGQSALWTIVEPPSQDEGMINVTVAF